MKKKIIIYVVSVSIVLSSLYLLQCLVMPKYMSGVIEGAFVSEYYQSTKDHDVLFLGDCETYGNFDPMVLWQDYGINAYIRGSAQQLTWQSYYLLEDTLRYETPDVVVFTVSPLKHDEPQHEAYNRMTLDGMAWSISKIKSIFASMTNAESFLDYLFPLLRYHSRWNELTIEDFTYLFKRDLVSQNGYYLRVDTNPFTTVPDKPILSDYSLGENAMNYLDRMVELCNDRGIEFMLIKAPSVYPHWYDEWDDQVNEYANSKGINYLNFTPLVDELEIDLSVDTYDAGLHLNLSGAAKLTNYFGQYLQDTYTLEDRRNEIELSTLWQIKYDRYVEEIEKQKKLYDVE